MSGQSGEYLSRKDRQSLQELRDDAIDYPYQQAVAWRARLRTGQAKMRDTSLAVIYEHVDALIKAATTWRGRWLSGKHE
jgi:late competence protein required for DNA uptake (superfamily II DNA/RNA helicase)